MKRYNANTGKVEEVVTIGEGGSGGGGEAAETHTFHNAATAAADGTPFTVGSYKTLTVEIYGTSTSRTVEFKAVSLSGSQRVLQGTRISDFTMASSTTGSGEIWQFDITGLESVLMDLTAVAGGNVTVKGKAVT